jgi:hypothetical protein
MKRLLIALALSIAPGLGRGEDHGEIRVGLPASPEMAIVAPGVQVVVGQDEEIFYTNHRWWMRHDGRWYHASHHHDAFVPIDVQRVPSVLMRIATGRYRHHHAEPGDGHHAGYDEGEGGCGHGHH